MSHVLLALGAGTVTMSGAVWYVPALTDLRAGDDRPVSARIAACACLTGWGTGALLTVLLLVPAPWLVLGAAAVAGAAATVLLGLRARASGQREQREEARRWAPLRGEVAPVDPRRAARAFLVWALAGLVLATVTAGAVLSTGGGGGSGARVGAAVATAATTSAAFLLVAAVHARALRGRPGVGRH